MEIAKKLKSIRLSEKLTQFEFSQCVDIPIGSIKNYEQGLRNPTSENLLKITAHLLFKKYALWLMTGDTAPESNQPRPDFSILLRCGLIDEEAEKRA
ncbi:XRE family transcriptional regulator [Psychromonas sp. PRT-SC03]|nr:XRE family transcriptional regulator [Psychromonas sp. PRT-SC03]